MMTWTEFLTDEAGARSTRLKSTAVTLSAALHGLVVLPLIELPQPPAQMSDDAIAVTLEFEPQPHGEASGTSVGQAAMPEPSPTQALLLAAPAPIEPPTAAQSLDSPPVAASSLPKSEEILAPVEAPPPVDARDFAPAKPAVASSKAALPPSPPAPAAATTHPVREARRQDAPGSAGQSPSFSAGSGVAQRQAEENYFRQIVQKISSHRLLSAGQNTIQHGLVVTRLIIALDGQLLDVALLRSSGFPDLDRAVVDTIHQASPFPPPPAGRPQTFVVPVSYTRDR
jgi:periplasmic protein TonB